MFLICGSDIANTTSKQVDLIREKEIEGESVVALSFGPKMHERCAEANCILIAGKLSGSSRKLLWENAPVEPFASARRLVHIYNAEILLAHLHTTFAAER